MIDTGRRTELLAHIAVHRERAAQARRLAEQVSDNLARQGLLRHAAEIEARAQELQAQLAALVENSQATEPDQNIAALKLPPEEPETRR
jgi:hypothetical protein